MEAALEEGHALHRTGTKQSDLINSKKQNLCGKIDDFEITPETMGGL